MILGIQFMCPMLLLTQCVVLFYSFTHNCRPAPHALHFERDSVGCASHSSCFQDTGT